MEKFKLGKFRSLGLYVPLADTVRQFGIQTQFLLSSLPEVSRVLCVGAAGGPSKTRAFDVVVADSTIEHDYTERFDPAPHPSFSGCPKSIAQLREIAAQ